MTCFGSRRNHHQGEVLCFAKTTKHGFSVHVGIDVGNVMAAYQPVMQACGSPWRQELICRHNIDYVYIDEHRQILLVAKDCSLMMVTA